MKRKLRYISILIALPVVFMVSCSQDFLDLDPLGQIASETTWKDGPLSEAFVTNLYNGLGTGGFDEEMLASLSDEAVFTHTGRGINIVNEGSSSPSNQGWTRTTFEWNAMYRNIRGCNVALENLETASFEDAALKERLKGEAHFLRGFYYHQLLRFYGGVPLVKRAYGLDEDYSIERSSYEDCSKFILDECDTAILYLTGKSMAKGRATVLAALAMKSRQLTYDASDLHDIPTAKENSPTISSYPNPEVLGFVSGDRAVRWEAAKTAAKAVLDAGAGYKLNLSAPVSPEEGQANYKSIAMAGGSTAAGVDASAATELIFGRFNTPDKEEWGSPYVGLFNGPNGYHNWAGNTPIGLLVDDYEMMDGTKFSWTNTTHKAKPYVNRDPRFYATIQYDGSDWKPRDKISGNVDPANQIQTGSYDLIQGTALISFKGLDTRSSSIEDWNGTRSGYYTHKFTDPNPAIIENNTRQYIPWPFFRYTEALFNYVEACIELNQDEEARNWLNKIRFRSGMPAITESGTALRDRYRNERRIELSFEDHRYHDARRWMIAPATLGRKLTYINVIGKFKPGKTLTGTYKHDETIYDYSYTPYEDVAHENRTWVDKMYFRPIVRDEMTKNNKLVQNPGYE